jgi:hypothetical protein
MERLSLAAQEMGGPLNVVIGRMEYLLERGSDKETTRSLNAIMPQTAYELYLPRGAVETPPRIGSGRSGSSKQDNYCCEVDRFEIPRMGLQGNVVIVGEKRMTAAGSRSPPLRHGPFSRPMKRVKQCEHKTLSQLIHISGKGGHWYEDH